MHKKNFVGKLEGKRPLGRLKSRMDLEIMWEGVNWIYLSQGRDQWRALVNPRVP
jgi:hypothetical protein